MHARLLGVVVACLAVALPAQDKKAPKRVHVIGASVSGGFEDGPLTGAPEQEDTVALHLVLKKWADGEVRVSAHPPMAMCGMFNDPDSFGAKMVEIARKKKADVIVAADFLFWFAYGWVLGDQMQGRGKRFERGLKLLEKFDVPVLVGDLPDMSGASTRLLKPGMIAPPEVLEALNKRLVEWAGKHDNITVVPLAKLVKQLKSDGVELPLVVGNVKAAPGSLLQGDGLHTNRLGVAYLMYQLQKPLRAQFPKGHPLNGQQWKFERFVEAAGAEEVLDELREAVEKKQEAK